MDPISSKTALAAAGAAGEEALYVDDVFSTYLFDGTGATQTITNGIDLSGEGGLVWIKRRSAADPHQLYDTERGANKLLRSTTTAAEVTSFSDLLTSFNSNGFSLGADSGGFGTNPSSSTMVSWTFRKAPGFFDVVTYSGDGTNRAIAHNLGSKPGCFLVKSRTESPSNWVVYHTSLGATKYLTLDTSNAAATSQNLWNNTEPTATHFTVHADQNKSGHTYVAYLFAHDDQSFGTNSDEAIIKCGSFSSNGSGEATVDLGFEPQWVLWKRTDSTSNWFLADTVRGMFQTDAAQSPYLRPNLSNAEADLYIETNSAGFFGSSFTSNSDWIYVAIRRPHKPPEAGTDVFKSLTVASSESGVKKTTDFVVDLSLQRVYRTGTGYSGAYDRLRGSKELRTNAISAESSVNFDFDFNDGYVQSFSNLDGMSWNFRRAPGFFDVVAYDGTGATLTLNHNLTVAPELAIYKLRSGSTQWFVDSVGQNKRGELNNTGSFLTGLIFNNGYTSSTISTTDTGTGVNASGSTYIAYLFATLPGISKVGTYSGTGNNVDVNCGFTAGARFVLIRRTDSTGDWYVWDSTRGIVSGNDPYLLLNTSDAEVTNTDYLDPLNAGFTVTSSAPAALNASGGNYIFLAIA